MKTLIYQFVGLLLLLAGFSSCRNEDEPTPVSEFEYEENYIPHEGARYTYNLMIQYDKEYLCRGYVTWLYGWNIIAPMELRGGNLNIGGVQINKDGTKVIFTDCIDKVTYKRNGKLVSAPAPTEELTQYGDFMTCQILREETCPAKDKVVVSYTLDINITPKDEISDIKIWTHYPIYIAEIFGKLYYDSMGFGDLIYGESASVPISIKMGAWENGKTDYSIPGIYYYQGKL